MPALALGLIGLAFVHGRTIFSGFSRLPGDLGDTRFNLLILEYGYRWLQGWVPGHSFWSPSWNFYPLDSGVARSDNLLGDLPFYALARGFGADAPHAFALWIVSCSVLNFLSAAWAARCLGASRLGAGVAGYLFAFAMPRAQQSLHAQLFPHFWTALCLVAILKSIAATQANARLRASALICLACWLAFAQIAAGLYLGCFLLLGLAFAALVTALSCGDRAWRSTVLAWGRASWPGLVLGLSSIAGPAFLLLKPYAALRAAEGGRTHEAIADMLPTLHSYFFPMRAAYFTGWLAHAGRSLPMNWEQVMFAGLAPLCALAWAGWRSSRPSPTVRVSNAAQADNTAALRLIFGTWLLTVLCTLRVGGESVWWIVSRAPGLDALRSVTRIATLQLLFGGLALALWITETQRTSHRAWILAAGIALWPVLENAAAVPADVSAQDVMARANALSARVLEAPCPSFFYGGQSQAGAPAYVIQLDAMWASLLSGHPTLNGYTGKDPNHWPLGVPQAVDRAALSDWMISQGRSASEVCLLE